MDCIPGKVEFRFGMSRSTNPDPQLVAERNPKVLADIEGLLTIAVDGQVVFEEDGVLLMELAIDIENWLRDIRKGHSRDFEYVSIDYADGALLRFAQDGSYGWTLHSPWVESRRGVVVEKVALVSAAEDYVRALWAHLRNRFGIDIADYLRML